MFGPYSLPAGGRTIVSGGDGNDRIDATSSALPVTIDGQNGNDQINGGSGDDRLFGGTGHDLVGGREGNDVVVGGDGNDQLMGFGGADVMIGGTGADQIDGGAGEDLLIAAATSYDANDAALAAILADWTSPGDLATRASRLGTRITGGISLRWGQTVIDDGAMDVLNGGSDADWLFLFGSDQQFTTDSRDLLTRQ
jgi:Ca2+-binding RTX toxin-like protein